MFLIVDGNAPTAPLVFTRADPRAEGYAGHVTDGVSLHFDPAVPDRKDGDPPHYVLARSPTEPREFVVFRTARTAAVAGYVVLADGIPEVHHSWRAYTDQRDRARRRDEPLAAQRPARRRTSRRPAPTPSG